MLKKQNNKFDCVICADGAGFSVNCGICNNIICFNCYNEMLKANKNKTDDIKCPMCRNKKFILSVDNYKNKYNLNNNDLISINKFLIIECIKNNHLQLIKKKKIKFNKKNFLKYQKLRHKILLMPKLYPNYKILFNKVLLTISNDFDKDLLNYNIYNIDKIILKNGSYNHYKILDIIIKDNIILFYNLNIIYFFNKPNNDYYLDLFNNKFNIRSIEDIFLYISFKNINVNDITNNDKDIVNDLNKMYGNIDTIYINNTNKYLNQILEDEDEPDHHYLNNFYIYNMGNSFEIKKKIIDQYLENNKIYFNYHYLLDYDSRLNLMNIDKEELLNIIKIFQDNENDNILDKFIDIDILKDIYLDNDTFYNEIESYNENIENIEIDDISYIYIKCN